MPWSAGVFTRQYGSSGWQNDKNAGTKILASRHDTNDDDLATGISACVAKDGTNQPLANLPMGGFHHTGVSDATSLDQYASAKQLQNSAFTWLTTVSGTDTITASASAAPSAYVAGQAFRFVAAGSNATTSPTLNINSLGAKSIKKDGALAVAAGDLPSGSVIEVVYDGTNFQLSRPSEINGGIQYLATVGGTVDAITATALFSPGAYAAGQTFRFIAAGANTSTTPTLNISSLGAKTLVRNGALALAPGDIQSGAIITVTYDGTNFQVTGGISSLRQSASVATTSGTSIDFTSIPAWVKRITVLLNGVSLSGTTNLRVQLGVGGVPESATYSSGEGRIVSPSTAAYNTNGASGFDAQDAAGVRNIYGSFVFENFSGNTWLARWVLFNDALFIATGCGVKSLSGTLNMVRLTNSGADTFDAGAASLLWE